MVSAYALSDSDTPVPIRLTLAFHEEDRFDARGTGQGEHEVFHGIQTTATDLQIRTRCGRVPEFKYGYRGGDLSRARGPDHRVVLQAPLVTMKLTGLAHADLDDVCPSSYDTHLTKFAHEYDSGRGMPFTHAESLWSDHPPVRFVMTDSVESLPSISFQSQNTPLPRANGCFIIEVHSSFRVKSFTSLLELDIISVAMLDTVFSSTSLWHPSRCPRTQGSRMQVHHE